jgi:hypothetical protein
MRALSRSVVGLALVVAVALVTALPASAAAVDWSVPVSISGPGVDISESKLVTDGTTITAVWSRNDGTNYRIQTASSTDGGTTWSTPVTLSDAGQNAFGPQVVTDGTTITAAWYRYDGSNHRIQTASSTDGGTTWSTPVTLSDAGGTALAPQLVTDGTTITAVWYRGDGSNRRIQSASSTDGGTTWDTPVTLSDAGQDAVAPQLVTDGTTITAVWQRNDGSDYRIQSASSTDGGTTWSTPVTLSDAATNASDAQLVTDGTTITAVWYGDDGTNYLVETASSPNGGITWSTPVTVSGAGQDAFEPRLVTNGTTITTVWYRFDGSKYRIQGASSTDGGTIWSTPVTISEPGQDAFKPQPVTDGTTITVAWELSDGNTIIHTASSTDGGTTWSTPVAISDIATNGSSPQLVTNGTTVTVMWNSRDGTNYRVQASSSTPTTGPALAATGGSASLIAGGALTAGLLIGAGLLLARSSRKGLRASH